MADKPAYIRDRPILSSGVPRTRTRNQWETLLAVDQLVGRIVQVLRDTGRLSNTLFIFTSDNGLLNQEHRWAGKEVPWGVDQGSDGDVVPGHHPRGLGVQRARLQRRPGAHDRGLRGCPARRGRRVAPAPAHRHGVLRESSILLEHLRGVTTVPSYCGVRTPSFLFVRYRTGEEELYDLVDDPRQLRNVVRSRPNKANELRGLTQSLCVPTPPGFSW